MKDAWRGESDRQDDASVGCSSSSRGFELARCSPEGMLIRKVDLQSDSRQLRVVARFAGLDSRILRNVVSLDEKCLRQCLEWGGCGKASKVMPSDAAFALTESVIDGKKELWRRLAIKRASVLESMNSNVDSARFDRRRLQSPTLYLTDARPGNSLSRADVSTSFSSVGTSHSATSGSVSQGMLAFRWMNGMPRFVFSPDEDQDVYVADLTSVASSVGIDPDYKYMIRINEHGMEGRAIGNGCHYLVGEINVVESMSVCSETRTIEFVLFGGFKIPVEEARGDQTRKSKAVKAFPFKSRRSSKRRNEKNFSDESSQEDKVAVLQGYRHSSNEIAAIVVKDRVKVKGTTADQKPESGGWGLKILRKIEAATATATATATANIIEHSDECTESMTVIIPAGLHGRPTSESGGTSSLIERWKSGGKCDCCGWDLGCPLTLLETRSTETSGNLRTVDLVVGGSNTALRMTNVRDGLLLIRFDQSLSALQTLSVAVAYIHSHSPLLRQRLRRS